MSDDAQTRSRGLCRRRGLADLFAGGAVLRAIGVAIVVGTVLNVINQGEALIGHGKVEWAKLALTYSVPFFVSLHGAVYARPRGAASSDPRSSDD